MASRALCFSLYDEIGVGGQRRGDLLFYDQGEFADVLQHFFPLYLFFLPFRNIVICLLLLQPLKYLLVLPSDLHQFSFPSVSIQATFLSHAVTVRGHGVRSVHALRGPVRRLFISLRFLVGKSPSRAETVGMGAN